MVNAFEAFSVPTHGFAVETLKETWTIFKKMVILPRKPAVILP
jgi:hypothetical protein